MAEATVNPARDLVALWGSNAGRFTRSRNLIEECARWARQEIKPRVPEALGVPQGFAVTLPHSTTMGQDVASFVARRKPSFKRKPLGGGTRAERAASKVEEFLQESFVSKLLLEGEPLYDVFCSAGTHDAEYAVLVQPATSHYAGFLAFQDDQGNISATWQRNAAGLDLEEYAAKNGSASGFNANQGKSAAAHQSYLRDYKARRWPITVRLLSPAEYQPLGKNPLTQRLDTILIRSQCSASHLKAEGFEWWDQNMTSASSDAADGPGRSYWLYELHTSNPWRIVYQIVGLDNQRLQSTKDGQPTQLGLDLGKEYGLQHVLAGVFYGWHRAHEKDPDRRGIPLLSPFIGVLGASNVSITGIVEHLHKTGFGGWGVHMQPELMQVWEELGRPTSFDLQDNAIHLLLGQPVSLVHQGVGGDAWKVLEFLFGLVEKFNEAERIRQSPDASSIAQTTSLATVDTVLGQITAGALGAVKMVAESVLELVAVLSQEMGASIPVYCTLNKKGQEQTHVELTADDLMGDYTIDVEQPTPKGSNLPKAQAMLGWMEAGVIGKYEWREDGYGDPQPEGALDRIAAEHYVDGQDGQTQLGQMVSKLLGDREAQQIRGLQDSGQVTAGGLPSAAVPVRPNQSGVAPNGVPMPQYPNQAASALGGSVAAAVNPGAQTAVVQATGTGAETAPP